MANVQVKATSHYTKWIKELTAQRWNCPIRFRMGYYGEKSWCFVV